MKKIRFFATIDKSVLGQISQKIARKALWGGDYAILRRTKLRNFADKELIVSGQWLGEDGIWHDFAEVVSIFRGEVFLEHV